MGNIIKIYILPITDSGYQRDCVHVTYLRLTNSSFCLIWARINHFKARRLRGLTQKVESKVRMMAISKSILLRSKTKWRLQCLKFYTVSFAPYCIFISKRMSWTETIVFGSIPTYWLWCLQFTFTWKQWLRLECS